MEEQRPVRSRWAWTLASVVLAALFLTLLTMGAEGPAAVIFPSVIAILAVGVTSWALIRSRAERRRYERQLADWAGERAVHAERLRIARELHDIVSHGLGLITVRTAAARHVSHTDPEAERTKALADVEQISRQTTTELRRMLALLFDPDEHTAPLAPTMTLNDLPAIVDGATANGMSVTLSVDDVDDVSPGVQVAVCAIVREALTNTARHAGPTEASVEVRRDGDTVVASVRDSGPRGRWEPLDGTGHGLHGLRERVNAFGGTLLAAPIDHGFHLTARIPDVRSA